ncbi:MAG: beta-propeller fold lactonase family protein [Verrucomicrobia bacterium]|nr:beta-propeller fold lactonase family protein [Verrucomicrobiota bacterium]
MTLTRWELIDLAVALLFSIHGRAPAEPAFASPTALVAAPDGSQLFIACATANQVAVFDTESAGTTHRIEVPAPPLGLTLSRNGALLYVSCAAPLSTICVIDTSRREIIERIQAGHTAMAPVLSPDEKTLYVCNRFNDDVSVIDLAAGRKTKRVRVEREPVAAAITPNGQYLVVANHLHAGAANHVRVGASVSIIDTTAGRVAKDIPLTEGAGLLRGAAVSPDGRFAAVTFVRARYWLSTTGVELGRINCNALGLLDMERLELLGILLLDQTAYGAANPWAVTWTTDGKTIVVSHAGTHELSLVDAPVEADPSSFFNLRIGTYANDGRNIRPPPKHPVRVRKRLPLPGNGPRALAVAGSKLYVANYFSDNLCRIDLTTPEPSVEALQLVLRPKTGKEGWTSQAPPLVSPRSTLASRSADHPIPDVSGLSFAEPEVTDAVERVPADRFG